MGRATTRGQNLQVKPGAMLARSKRRLDQARRLIEQVAYDWYDIISAVEFECEQAVEKIDVISTVVTNAASYLRQPDDGEPFDG